MSGNKFATQVETLKKHRTGGEQRVTGRYVNIFDAGLAIVRNVQHRVSGHQ